MTFLDIWFFGGEKKEDRKQKTDAGFYSLSVFGRVSSSLSIVFS